MNFSPVRWKEAAKPTHLLVCDGEGVHIFTGRGEKVTDLDAQRFEGLNPAMFAGMNECRGTSVRFSKGTFFATLVQYRVWLRSVLYLHDAEGRIAYQEVFMEHCQALAPRPGQNSETLLVACEEKVWEYSPAKKSALPATPAPRKK